MKYLVLVLGFAVLGYSNSFAFDIYNLNDFNTFVNSVNSGNDYSGDTVNLWINVTATVPIGTPSNPFRGTFAGGNNPIALYIDTNLQYVGLFGYVEDATIRNIIVTGTVRQIYPSVDGFAGSIVGFAKNSQITNCISEVNVTSNGSAGGIIGKYLLEIPLVSIPVFMNINNKTVKGRNKVGGIIGEYSGNLESRISISQCLNNGRIILNNPVANSRLGGIVGSATNCRITEVLNIGSIVIAGNPSPASASTVGGIAGYLDDMSFVNIAINSGLVGGIFNNNSAFGGLVGGIDNNSIVKNSINTGVISIDPRAQSNTYDMHPLVGAGGGSLNVIKCYADYRMYRYDYYHFYHYNGNLISGMVEYFTTEEMVSNSVNGNVLDNDTMWIGGNSFRFSNNYIYPMIGNLYFDTPNNVFQTMATEISKVAASPVFFGENNFVPRNVRSDFYASRINTVDWRSKDTFGNTDFNIPFDTSPPASPPFPIPPFDLDAFYINILVNGNGFNDFGWYANVLNKQEQDTLEAGLDNYRFKKQIPIINKPYSFPIGITRPETCSKPTLTLNPPQEPFHNLQPPPYPCDCICYIKCDCCKLAEQTCNECSARDAAYEAEIELCTICPIINKLNCGFNQARCGYCRQMTMQGIVVYDCIQCQDLIDGCIQCAQCRELDRQNAQDKEICNECRIRKKQVEKCVCYCESMKEQTGFCNDANRECPTINNIKFSYGCNVDCYTLTLCTQNTLFMQAKISAIPDTNDPMPGYTPQTPLGDTILSDLPYEFFTSTKPTTGLSQDPKLTTLEFCVPKGTAFCIYFYLWGQSGRQGYYVICDPSTPSPYKESFEEAFEFSTSFTVSDVVPSPVRDEASFTVNFTEDGFMDVSVYDMSGAKIFDVLSNASVTANTEQRIAINFAKLPSGVYTIMVQVGNVIVPRVFIKQ